MQCHSRHVGDVGILLTNISFFRQSLEEPAGFARDAVGRQSMSEKRHATLDAKNTDTYRRNKKIRDERQDSGSGGSGRHQDAVSGRIAEIRQELMQRKYHPHFGAYNLLSLTL